MDSIRPDRSFALGCERLSKLVDRLALYAAGGLFLINIGDIVMGVFARYFFQSSPVWTEELARYTLIWMVMLAAAPALKRGEHMGIDLVVKRFPQCPRSMAAWVRHFVFLFITGFMVYFGYLYAMKVIRFNTMALGIPKTLPMMAIPVGMGLLFLQYILLHFSREKT